MSNYSLGRTRRAGNNETMAPATPDTVKAWVKKVTDTGAKTPSIRTQQALTTFYNGLVSTELLHKMITVNCVVPDSLSASLTPLIKNSGYDTWIVNEVVDSDLTINGLKGNGSSKYLNTGIIPMGTYSTGSASGTTIYVYKNNTIIPANGNISGFYDFTV